MRKKLLSDSRLYRYELHFWEKENPSDINLWVSELPLNTYEQMMSIILKFAIAEELDNYEFAITDYDQKKCFDVIGFWDYELYGGDQGSS